MEKSERISLEQVDCSLRGKCPCTSELKFQDRGKRTSGADQGVTQLTAGCEHFEMHGGVCGAKNGGHCVVDETRGTILGQTKVALGILPQNLMDTIQKN